MNTLCGPFGDYVADPHSVFMTLELPAGDRAPQRIAR
jgi:putative acetyltransferase